MMLTSTLENIGIVDAGIVALLGYAVVFFGISLLMFVVMAMGKFFIAKDAKAAAAAKAFPTDLYCTDILEYTAVILSIPVISLNSF